MMTTLYLARHGETVDNARQIMQGQTQGELNENGVLQAEAVSREWASRPLDAIVASDLKRSIDTAQIIARPHQLQVITTPLLRERDWGGFTGRFIPDLKGEVWPDDIESEEALLLRARTFLLYLTTTYPDKRVVAVGHGIINKAVLAVYAQCPMREVQRMMNCEVRILSTSAVTMASATTAACTAVVRTATATSAEGTAAVAAESTAAVAAAERAAAVSAE